MKDQGSGFFLRIAAELVVVFIGVSAAFVVDNYREGIEAERRAKQLAVALTGDLQSYATTGVEYAAAIRAGLAGFEAARAKSGRPVPWSLRVAGAEGAPIDVWEAAMQSGAGEVIDPDLVLELASVYHEIGGQSTKYLRYAEFTERNVWPVEAGDTSAFYDATGRLRPEYAAHMRQAAEIAADLERSAARAATLVRKLEARYPATNTPDTASNE